MVELSMDDVDGSAASGCTDSTGGPEWLDNKRESCDDHPNNLLGEKRRQEVRNQRTAAALFTNWYFFRSAERIYSSMHSAGLELTNEADLYQARG